MDKRISLRPTVDSAKVDETTHPNEVFQNETLRPIIKMQHLLILAFVSDHVLKDFDEDEMLQLEKITNNIINAMPLLIDKKLDLFSSTVNNK